VLIVLSFESISWFVYKNTTVAQPIITGNRKGAKKCKKEIS